MAETVSTQVFSEDFQQHPAFEEIQKIVNKSPYMVGMLNHLAQRGGQVKIGPPSEGSSNGIDISIGRNWVDLAIDHEFAPTFVTMIAHEGGHTVLPNGSDGNYRGEVLDNPWKGQQADLYTEGVAVTAEYIVARQLKAPMWSGDPDVLAQRLGQIEAAHHLDLSTRTFGEASPELAAFDHEAHLNGAEYYSTRSPSKAPNLMYNEFYLERRAAGLVMGNEALHIDWQQVKPGHIQVELKPDRSYTVEGNQVPLMDGKHVSFSAHLSADSKREIKASQTQWLPIETPSPAARPITSSSSVNDMFDALYIATLNKDDHAARDIGKAYLQSDDGQAFLAQGKAFNQELKAQEQQATLQQAQEQQQTILEAPVHSGPVMRR